MREFYDGVYGVPLFVTVGVGGLLWIAGAVATAAAVLIALRLPRATVSRPQQRAKTPGS